MRARRGFTLIEVMAAVAVIGLVFSLLARMNIQGLRAEGRAARQLAAGLVADRVLAELEASLLAGVTPPLGRNERREDDFRVQIDVAGFELVLPPPEGRDVPDALQDGGDSDDTLIRARQRPRTPSSLRQIDVVVAWDAPGGEERIARRTFGYDRTVVDRLLAAVAQSDADAADAAAAAAESGS